MFGKTFEKTIKVEGMRCMHCAKRVEDAIKNIDGVKKVNADFNTGDVKIFSKTEIADTIIKNVVENIGYEVL